MQKTQFYKANILQLKNLKRLKKKTQITAMVGLAFSASLCQILPVLMQQTKTLVLPPCITDESRDTERLSILSKVTQMKLAGLGLEPMPLGLWSSLELTKIPPRLGDPDTISNSFHTIYPAKKCERKIN